nr:hypothetical protein [Actinospica robiniae]
MDAERSGGDKLGDAVEIRARGTVSEFRVAQSERSGIVRFDAPVGSGSRDAEQNSARPQHRQGARAVVAADRVDDDVDPGGFV